MTTDLQARLQELTALPNTTHPFLSIYLDWTPDGSGKRHAPRILEQELGRIAEQLTADGIAIEGFETDRQRILEYVTDQAPKEAQGLAIFACEGEGVWVTLALQTQVTTEIVADRYAHTFQLARIIDDYETFAVVIADSQESRIFVSSLNDATQVGQTEASEEIKRFDAGGSAQMVFQHHTQEVIKAHTKDIAERLERIVRRYNVAYIIIAGNDSIKGSVMNALSDRLKEKLVDYIKLDAHENMQALQEAVAPLMHEVERRQEAAEIVALQDQVYENGLGAVGIAQATQALSKGQVHKLFLLSNFAATGGECPSCGALRPGQRTNCPYDGTEMQQVDLREAFTARAVQQGAALQIVQSNDYLAQHEGVGVLLRYREKEL